MIAEGKATADPGPRAPTLLQTGVPNLDRILGGGLPRGALAMLLGAPGTGKTILAQQIAFHQARQGGIVLYLTGYSETHEKLLQHNRGLRYFAPEFIGQALQFGSLPELLRQGAAPTEEAIVGMTRAQHATLVVLDGFRSMRGLLADDAEVAHFLYLLGAKLALLGATTLVLVEGDPDERARYPELTVCDVILGLRRERVDGRHRRLLEVLKVRGAAPLDGVHLFTISDIGIELYPRFESVVPVTEPAWTEERAGFGIASLDAVLGGGLHTGTTTLAAGSPGTGKTLLGLHFAAEGARMGEPVLFLGFWDSPAQLVAKARMFGMDVTATAHGGRVQLVVLPGYDLEVDVVTARLAQDIERRGVRRLIIDSVAHLTRGITEGRLQGFLAALLSYLRGRGVTTCLTLDVSTIGGPDLAFAETPLSVLAENVLLLRHVEYYGRFHRIGAVLKMRFSDHDRGIYEYAITAGAGLAIAGPAPVAEGLLTGSARAPRRRDREGDAIVPARPDLTTDEPWSRS